MNAACGRGPRSRAAAGLIAVWVISLSSFGAAARAAGAVVTAGNQQITFSGTQKSGVLGDAGGYDTLAFNLETGQGGMFGDLQIGSDSSGQATLSGTLEAVPASGSVSGPPTSSSVAATPGEVLLVLDGAGNYALVQVTNATSQTVWFTYAMQSSLVTTPPPVTATTGTPSQSSGSTATSTGASSTGTPTATQPPGQGSSSAGQSSTGAQPQTPSQGSGPSGSTEGVYTLPSNCANVSDSSGNTALQVVVYATPMFSQQLDATEMILNVGIAAPTDVSKVAVQQSGEIGGYPWTHPLYSFGQDSQGLWQFSMQQSDLSEPFQILITSPTLAADGIANPSTGVTELDWNDNSTQGCGGAQSGGQGNQAAAQGNQGVQAQVPQQGPSSQTTPPEESQNPQPAANQGVPQEQTPQPCQTQWENVRQPQLPVTIQLVVMGGGQPSPSTAAVNGQPTTINGTPPFIDAAGRTLIPFRFIGENLGASVGWNNCTRTASYKLGSVLVSVVADQSTITVNGQTSTMATEARIVGTSMMVPLRFVSQALGAEVDWTPGTPAGAQGTATVVFPAPGGNAGSSGGSPTSAPASSPSASGGATGGYSGGVPFGSCADCIHWNFN